jgi:glycosyltransferase involved in cell wall biosynthesis
MNSNPLLLIIGSVWPEPKSSAAGTRMMQLIEFFKSKNWNIHFASPASDSEWKFPLDTLQIQTTIIPLNDSQFNEFIKNINPKAVLFDRLMMEEQFGWRVKEVCPNALRILDTEDLHFLRHARHLAYKENRDLNSSDLYSEICKREIASIYRCDFSIIISKYEMELLKSTFKIPDSILLYLPILFKDENLNSVSNFEERKHFLFIGNFYHEPNKHAIILLKEKIWPIIRKQIPEAELHIYGAYVNEHFTNMNNTKTGFLIKGRAEDSQPLFRSYKVLLASMPFGAGLKGKILEAMANSCPFISNEIGAEGIFDEMENKEFICNNYIDFAETAVKIYLNKNKWIESEKIGLEQIKSKFNFTNFKDDLMNKTEEFLLNLEEKRRMNFLGEILHTEANQSKRYLSKWIEEKNRNTK